MHGINGNQVLEEPQRPSSRRTLFAESELASLVLLRRGPVPHKALKASKVMARR